MKHKPVGIALASIAIAASSGSSFAADNNGGGMSGNSGSMQSQRADPGASRDMHHDGMMDRGMMGGPMMQGGMMGMTNGMESCGAMMGSSAMTGRMMPQLPPGNEKLQLQMQVEMMQKMGEIVAKYAAQLDDRPGTR